MEYQSLDTLLDDCRRTPLKGPVAIIFAEDETEIASTVAHADGRGFRTILLIAPAHVTADPGPGAATAIRRATHDFQIDGSVPEALTQINRALAPGTWVYWGYNAEYLVHPFCETRSVNEMLTFHAEERRTAMLACIVDLYAPDLSTNPDGVSRADAWFDEAGYYALQRHSAAGNPLERQIDLFGGLRWRFEEHVPWERRRIDRIALYRSRPGLEMRADFTLSDEEMNTAACPWHHNVTAAVVSFRAAKALRANPGSRWAIPSFQWSRSRRFEWTSHQLMNLGLIEPGQWF